MIERRHPHGTSVCNAPPDEWRVLVRNGNFSAFNGYHRTPSDYSACECSRCGWIWRTKAAYVRSLRDHETRSQ